MQYLQYPLQLFNLLQENTNTATAVVVPGAIIDTAIGGIIGGKNGVILAVVNNIKLSALLASAKYFEPSISDKLSAPNLFDKLSVLPKVAETAYEKTSGDYVIKSSTAALVGATDAAINVIAYCLGQAIKQEVDVPYSIAPTGTGLLLTEVSNIIKLAVISAISEGYIPELEQPITLEQTADTLSDLV